MAKRKGVINRFKRGYFASSSSSERVAASALADLIGTEVEEVSNPMEDASLEDVKVSDESVNLFRRINQKDKNKKKLAPGPIDPLKCTKLESTSKIIAILSRSIPTSLSNDSSVK